MRRAALAAAVMAGCGLQPSEPLLDVRVYGWLSEVAWQPERFAALTSPDQREGWIALHAHRYEDAWSAFPEGSVGRGRAAWQLGALHDDLSRLSGVIHAQLIEAWAERGLPEGSAAPVVAALAARCTEVGDLKRWTEASAGRPGVELLDPKAEGPWSVDLQADHPWAPSMARHRVARQGQPEALQAAADPAVTEAADGFQRKFYDPCVHRTLSDTWTARVGPNPLKVASTWAEPLEGRLFSPWLGPEDLRVSDALLEEAPAIPFPHLGRESRSLAGLPSPDAGDEVQDARESVRALDALLDRWHTTLLERADADGRALLKDLGMVARLRQEHLIVRARAALLAERPHHALALLQLARDASARTVGPDNSPQLFALMAEAEARVGRTREALDALHPLAEAYPEVRALEEVAGDLAVLKGLDRRGDSREQ